MRGPLAHSETLGRVIRQDGIATLGTSSQTLFEQAIRRDERELAAALVAYFWDEMLRIGEALFSWLEDIVAYRLERDGAADAADRGVALVRGLRRFDPSGGDRARALLACAEGRADAAIVDAELMRVRYASLHDAYVAWIQDLLTEIAEHAGEDAVYAVIERSAERLWRPRYASWGRMTPLERLQLSVEGMRGHLSGTGRRGDVGIVEEPDRFVMVLDPCGSCGILRRGDPESGRRPAAPAGNRTPHAWTWNRTGVGWYAVHSPIVMEHLWMRDGQPPLRPHEGCDADGPCRWFVYKDPAAARPEHYARQGFAPPAS